MNINEFITKYEPCSEAAEWLQTQPDIQTAWENCKRPDWMFWALFKTRPLSEQQSAALSVALVRETPLSDGRFVIDLVTDKRSLTFLRMKEEWGASPEGTPKPEGWAAAWAAARAAAVDAEGAAAVDAAWAAAMGAAWAAAWAAAMDAAWAAAMGAAWDAARDAAWDAAWAAAWADARDAAGGSQANIIRRFVPRIEL